MSIRKVFHTIGQFHLHNGRSGGVGGVGDLSVPMFKVNPAHVSVIGSPGEFYAKLKELTLQSKTRICLSSLYIGTGKLEKDLLQCLLDTKRNHDSDLSMSILLDYNRSTRETITTTTAAVDNLITVKESSRSLLLPLVHHGAEVNFYLTPTLGGWFGRWLQQRQKWNEVCALHHMKFYLFDNSLLISGANLSDTYFTNRQDRNVLIHDAPALCDYVEQLIRTVGQFSMNLQRDGTFRLNPTWKYDPRFSKHRAKFCTTARQQIKQLNEQFAGYHNGNGNGNEVLMMEPKHTDTIVFPLLQMKSLGIDDEECFTKSLIKSCTKQQQQQLHFATGYFNLNPTYQTLLLDQAFRRDGGGGTPISILMASEEANGFYNGDGVLRYIPLVYTHYVRHFLASIKRRRKRLQQSNNRNRISLWYYNRPNWSFHAKGIWLFDQNFFATMFGSTNFGYRSMYRDNEAQLVLISADRRLRAEFVNEHRQLLNYSRLLTVDNGDGDGDISTTTITTDAKEITSTTTTTTTTQSTLPKVPFWVSCFATLFRSYF